MRRAVFEVVLKEFTIPVIKPWKQPKREAFKISWKGVEQGFQKGNAFRGSLLEALFTNLYLEIYCNKNVPMFLYFPELSLRHTFQKKMGIP